MSRLTSKRPHCAYDSSSASSSPTPTTIHSYHNSDVSSDLFNLSFPSDSPTNPFGRTTHLKPRSLPRATPVSEHAILRFQLVNQPHNVYRVVSVPLNYAFCHLSHLTQFLFNWKDMRTERNPYNKCEKTKRRAEHVFIVQKRAVVSSTTSRNAGLVKAGDTVAYIAGDIKDIKKSFDDRVPWEREECYTLQHLWHRPGSSSEMTRAIIYNYDVLSDQKEVVHITVYGDAAKLKERRPDLEEFNNLPYVLLGQGLPDDEDDEDFALDLQQWNEPQAFENYIRSQQEEDDEDDEAPPSPAHLEEQQARVKRQMLAPLPKRLPIDEDLEDDSKEDSDKAHLGSLTKPKPTNVATAEAKVLVKRRLSSHQPRLPNPQESREVGVYDDDIEKRKMKTNGVKRSFAACNAEESPEVGADVVARARARARSSGAQVPVSIPTEIRCLSPVKGGRVVEASPDDDDNSGDGLVDRVDSHSTEAEAGGDAYTPTSDSECSPQKPKRPRTHAPGHESDLEPKKQPEYYSERSDNLETVVGSSPSRGIPLSDSDVTKCGEEGADEKGDDEGEEDEIKKARVIGLYKPARAARLEIPQKAIDHCHLPLLDTVVQQKEAQIKQNCDESEGEAGDVFLT